MGIDAPERGGCGFDDAALVLAGLLEGKELTLVEGARDDRDRYGRLLRYVDAGGADSGLALIEAGLAVARHDSRDGYGPHPREDRYVAADTRVEHACAAARPAPPEPEPELKRSRFQRLP